MPDLNKKNMVKEIMETNNIFNSCDYTNLENESDRLLDYYEFYTPNKKRVIHNFLSNILHKKILSQGDYDLLKSHVRKILNILKNAATTNEIKKIMLIDTSIYIIDKIFLYRLKLDDSLLSADKTKQDFRYKILFNLDKNKELSNYIKLYKSFDEIKINDIFYINNDFYSNYFVVKGFIMNNKNNKINEGFSIPINKVMLFTYKKKSNGTYDTLITYLRVPYFYFICK
jgi:hypothetical protein